jgi:hypothetical protein
MRNVEPDAGELLVKALDLAVGASALARYGAGHTGDPRLRRLFRQFASTSEQQERVLRQQIARSASGSSGPGGRELVAYALVGLGAVALVGGAIAYALWAQGDRRGPPAAPGGPLGGV